ncbi:SirB2 family protein [Lonepinella sp. MS14435]|uniref:SirB2 family protein n=1 Tax=Lonepinella sp. MS14435 TaxID=3003618 RepID=UPI0036DB9AA0
MLSTIVTTHIIFAYLSLFLLVTRGAMQLAGKDWRAVKLLKILPHLSDTILLATGLFFLFSFGFSWWKIAKLACFVGYAFCAAKFFGKKVTNPKPVFFVGGVLLLLGAMFLGYSR